MSRQAITAGKAVIVVELTDKATAQFGKVMDGVANKLNRVSKSFRDLATNAFGGALGTGFLSGNLIRNFAKFDDLIRNMTVKLGYFGNKTLEQVQNVKSLEKEILRLGQTTAYTSTQVAEAAVALAQAGFAVEEIKASLQGVIDLARGTGHSLDGAAEMMANLIRNFNLFGANDTLEQRMRTTTELSSQLVKATRLGTIEISDLVESFKYASGKARQLGVSVEELLGFFVQMSEAGLRGSIGGTTLNTMMGNLAKNLDKIQEKFPQFNIMMRDAEHIDLTGTISNLVDLMKDMDVVSKSIFLQDVFNLRGERAISAVLEIERVVAFTKAIKGAAAEARLAAIEMEAGIGGAGRRAYSAIDNLRILMGKIAEKELVAFFNAIAGLANILGEFFTKNKELVLGLIFMPPVLAAIGVGALALAFTLSKLAGVVRVLGTAFSGMGRVGRLMVGSIAGTNAMLPKRKPSAFALQSAKVSRMQKAMDARMAAPGANLTRIARSRAMGNLIHEGMALQRMRQTRGLRGMAGRVGAVGRGAGQVVEAARARKAEIAFYRSREKVYNALKASSQKRAQFHSNMASFGGPNAAKHSAAAARYQNTARSAGWIAGRAGKMGAQARAGSGGLGVLRQMIQLPKLATVGKSLIGLGFGFMRAAAGITRFVFSWNFVGMALNALLLFGDKIPVIANAFAALGKGISGFFSQLGKIASYAGPAFELFQLAIDSFSGGFSDIGFMALQSAFEGIVSIIKNQLIAAWNEFMYHVEYVVVFFQQIYKSLEIIVRSLFQGITGALGVVSSPLMNAISSIGDLFSGGGFNLASIANTIVQGIDFFVTEFFKLIITLNDYLMEFLYKFQDVMGQVISKIPGTLGAGQSIRDQARTNQNSYNLISQIRKSELDRERQIRSKEIEAMMSIDTGLLAAQRRQNVEGANANSQQSSDFMGFSKELLTAQYLQRLADQQAENARLQEEANVPDPVSNPWVDPEALGNAIGESIKAVVGSVDQTRSYLKAMKDEKKVQDQQLYELQEIKRTIATQGIG